MLSIIIVGKKTSLQNNYTKIQIQMYNERDILSPKITIDGLTCR